MPFGQLPRYARKRGAPPTITATNYAYFDSLGGDAITITGTNLSGSTIAVGGTAATVTASSPTSLTFTTPAKTAGAANIVATNANGSSAGFTCESVSITGAGGTCQHWLRASLGATTGAGLIIVWADQSSAGRDLNTTNQSFPRYFSSDSDFNNKAVLGTTTTSEVRDIAYPGSYNLGGTTTKYWTFRVYSDNPNFCSSESGGRNDFTGSHWMLVANSTTYYGKNGLFVSGNWIAADTTYVVCAQYDSSTGNTGFYANTYGTNLGTGSFGTTNDSGLALGDSTGGAWRLGEYVCYSTTHSSTVREKVMKTLGCRYGVSVT